jgi:prepilin-type N-terminal cleavage/methylation domain-containing protein
MKKNGFTLVEMLVVIAIIILISVSAIPAITPFLKGQRLNKGARIVQASALAARTMAINSRKARWLVLDSINYKLSIKDETGSIVLGKEEFLPETIEFVTSTGTWIAGTSTVSFDPDGTATSNLDADTITIQDKQGNTKKLKIITYTGQIISD